MDNIYNFWTDPYTTGVASVAELQSTQFANDRRRLLAEPERIEPKIRNVIIPRFDVEQGNKEVCHLSSPLRVSVEEYPGKEFVAFLANEPTISGYGETLEEAVSNTMTMLADDLAFYMEADDENLTLDAIELKTRLLGWFKIADGFQ